MKLQVLGETTLLVVVLCLAGCGGGTSSTSNGNSSGSGSNTPPPNVPQSAPPMPAARYSGVTGQAAPSSTNALSLVHDALNALDACNLVAELLTSEPTGTNPIYQASAGIVSGNEILEGRIAADGAGWFTFEFNNYQDDPGTAVLNGLLIYQVPRNGSAYDATIGYSNLEIKEPGRDVLLNGVATAKGIVLVLPFGLSVDNLLVNLTADNKLGGNTLYLQNVSMTYGFNATIGAPIYTSLSGTVYDSALGSISLSSPGNPELAMAGTDVVAFYDGTMTLRGANGASVQFNSLNNYLAYVGLDPTGSGIVQQSARFDLVTGQLDAVSDVLGRQKPIAAVDQTSIAAVGQPVTLHGFYSHSPGGAFLSYQWNLKLVPPDSAVPTGVTQAATLTFTPDLPGDYLAILTVSDGTQTATDPYVLHVYPSSQQSSQSPFAGTTLGGDVEGTIGQKVQLDGRGADGLAFGGPFNWQLTVPAGSRATLVNPQSQTPHFVPDVPGYYLVSLSTLATSPGYMIVGVGVATHFTPAAQLMAVVNGKQDIGNSGTLGDVNGDGLLDVAYPDDEGGVAILTQSSNGTFSQNMIPLNGKASIIALTDVEGNGKTDVVAFADGYYALLQQADGSLGAPLTVSNTNDGNVLLVSPVGSNTAADVVLFGSDLSGNFGLTDYSYSAPNSFTSNFSAFGNYSNYISVIPHTLADVSGDGIPDVIATGSYQSSAPSVIVLNGAADGTFGAPKTYPLTFTPQTAVSVATGDLNGDGLKDVVVTQRFIGNVADIFYQQPDGTLGSGVQISIPNNTDVPTIADIDGDGRNDLLSFEQDLHGGDTVGFCTIGSCFLGMNLQASDGKLGKLYLYPVISNQLYLGSSDAHISVGDVDGDHSPDVLIGGNNFGNYIMFSIPFN